MKYMVEIKMLGDCKVSVWDGNIRKNVDFSGKRKVWMLFEFLYTNNRRCLSIDEIKMTLWGKRQIADPGNSIKVLVYELRKVFDEVFPGLGKQMIRYKLGTYYICDLNITYVCDAELFERDALLALDSDSIDSMELAKQRYSGLIQITDKESDWQKLLRDKYQSYYNRLVICEINLLMQNNRQDDAIKCCTDACLLYPKEKLFDSFYRNLTMGKNQRDTDGGICAVQ